MNVSDRRRQEEYQDISSRICITNFGVKQEGLLSYVIEISVQLKGYLKSNKTNSKDQEYSKDRCEISSREDEIDHISANICLNLDAFENEIKEARKITEFIVIGEKKNMYLIIIDHREKVLRFGRLHSIESYFEIVEESTSFKPKEKSEFFFTIKIFFIVVGFCDIATVVLFLIFLPFWQSLLLHFIFGG
ncbi:hypothetical protein RFI_36950 [Reticulomyxa filosa]|uniref:Uncharacterized protein n=1 Tax=Reticulomyxa filosa TaxID=46433 RepID=X6LIF5_RETFI|nr:hypothetical protein RFI_36950 [Reticulomyxa filosa]|eukprot:ETO00490.1 hypothetical protein RFI_36950 [Reticulomyxa filosa]